MAEAISEQIFKAKFKDDMTEPAAKATSKTEGLFRAMVAGIQSNLAKIAPKGLILTETLKTPQPAVPPVQRPPLYAEGMNGKPSVSRPVPGPSFAENMAGMLLSPLLLLGEAISKRSADSGVKGTNGAPLIAPPEPVIGAGKDLPGMAKPARVFPVLWQLPQMLQLAAMINKGGASAKPIEKKSSKTESEVIEEERKGVGMMKSAMSTMQNLFGGFISGFLRGKVLGPAVQSLLGVIEPLLVPVQDFVINLAKALQGPVALLLPKVQDFFINLTKKIQPFVDEMVPKLEAFLKDKSLKDIFDAMPWWVKILGGLAVAAPIIGTLGNMFMGFYGIFKVLVAPLKLILGLGRFLTAVPWGPLAFAIGVLLKLLGAAGLVAAAAAAGYAIGMFVDKLFGISDKIGSWLGEKMTVKLTAADKAQLEAGQRAKAERHGVTVPKLAEGGMVESTGLAIVHSGETFIPKQFRENNLSEQTGKDMIFIMRQMSGIMAQGFGRVVDGLAGEGDPTTLDAILRMS